MNNAGPLVPAWAVVPLAALAVIVITLHLRAIWTVPVAKRRRRIRTAAGLLLLVVVVLMAYALAVATPSRPQRFVLSWTGVAGLLAIVLVLAGLDALNSLRMHRARARELHLRLRVGMARARQETRGGPGENR